VKKIAALLAKASKPFLLAGANVYLDRAWDSMRAWVEAAQIPVLTNGLGRGTLAADHRLAFQRTRGKAFREADVVIVAGTPMDFRIGYGEGFSSEAAVIHLDSSPELIAKTRPLAVGLGADLDLTFRALERETHRTGGLDWVAELRAEETRVNAKIAEEGSGDRAPIHPLRLYSELKKFMARDAVVVCVGGDFVSYAGREIPSYVPGAWLDPGPFGCLGVGPGYAIAAKLRYPQRQVVLILGDGAFGFSGMEFDTMVRHKLPIVAVVGNNGMWALEKHPMKGLFGYDVAADLRQETRYDQVVQALGGHGERVTQPDQLGPAFKRAFEAGVPALVNVHIDPQVVYPRSANLM
jgi:acetolactate synthase-1/2/3 large subunit